MSSFIKKLFIIIILGFIVHLSFISVFPQLKAWSISRQASENNNINTAFQRDLADSNSTQIIRPSADLLYGGCGYDVTYKPLIISSGPLTSTNLSKSIEEFIGVKSLAFYDSISPIVLYDSLDINHFFRVFIAKFIN